MKPPDESVALTVTLCDVADSKSINVVSLPAGAEDDAFVETAVKTLIELIERSNKAAG